MKKILVFGFVLSVLFACSKEDIPVYDTDHYIQFVDPYSDSTEVSFFFYAGATEIEIPLVMKLVGMPLASPGQVALQTNVSLTTAQGVQYALPQEATFKAGQTMDTLHVKLKNVDLKQKVRLVVDIVNSSDLLGGQVGYTRKIIWFSTEISRPEWWNVGGEVEKTFLGRYSETKFRKFMEVTGVGDLSDKNYDERRALALEFKRELLQLRYNGTPYPDPELGLEDMSTDVPVLGY